MRNSLLAEDVGTENGRGSNRSPIHLTINVVVDRHSVRKEHVVKTTWDRSEKRILVIVGTKRSETLLRRKGKGSLAMQISQGLVDPNSSQKL